MGFKLEEVKLKGRKNVKLDDMILSINSDNIQLLDLEKIHTELKTNKWIDDLIISRKLPNSLEINIIEKTPIAIYQYKKKLYLVDKNGDTISEDIGNFKNLIHAIGYNANIHISNLINVLNEYEDIKKNIVYVSRYGDRRWNLVLKNNIVIKLPEGSIKESMEYLKSLYDSQKLFERDIEYIDMRNATRYYIKYIENK
jgi:cell division protein FtsQ